MADFRWTGASSWLAWLVCLAGLQAGACGRDHRALAGVDAGDDGSVSSGGDGSDTGNPADDSAVDGSTGAFSPRDLAGLALWLDASGDVVVEAGKVATWRDATKNGNDATQPTPASRPTLLTGAAGIGGRPAVSFNGTYLSIRDAMTLQWGTGDFALAAVFRYRNSVSSSNVTGRGCIFAKQRMGTPFPGPAMFANLIRPGVAPTAQVYGQTDYDHYVASTQTAANDNTAHLWVLRRVGTTVELRIDGAVSASAVQGSIDVSAQDVPANIGAQPDQGTLIQRLDGDIAEIAAVKGALTAPELGQLERYLKTRYGL